MPDEAHPLESIKTDRPVRIFTPDEMRRMMRGDPIAVRPPVIERHVRDRDKATQAADRLIAKYSGEVPICSASVTRSERDEAFRIRIIVGDWQDEQRLRGRIGYTFEGFYVTVSPPAT